MRSTKKSNMQKRGFILEVGALIIIALTTAGIIITVSSTNHLYVGNDLNNESENYYVDYFKCKGIAKSIPEENVKVFKSREEAINFRFSPVEGCV